MWSSISNGPRAAAPERDAAARRRGRLVVAAIFAVCAAPLVAALVAYSLFPPAGRTNYGELIEARPLPPVALERLDGRPFTLSEMRGKWVLVQADAAACGARCEEKLFHMRQVRLAQGPNRDRVERVWLVLDAEQPAPALAPLYAGAVAARAAPELLAALPGADVRDHIYLLDPRGNLILRFPKHADPKRMIKDLERLLKYSSVG
jgi:cytochrome oxidase Cu insertion factor (SCO1/SenC/PrrC family)